MTGGTTDLIGDCAMSSAPCQAAGTIRRVSSPPNFGLLGYGWTGRSGSSRELEPSMAVSLKSLPAASADSGTAIADQQPVRRTYARRFSSEAIIDSSASGRMGLPTCPTPAKAGCRSSVPGL